MKQRSASTRFSHSEIIGIEVALAPDNYVVVTMPGSQSDGCLWPVKDYSPDSMRKLVNQLKTIAEKLTVASGYWHVVDVCDGIAEILEFFHTKQA